MDVLAGIWHWLLVVTGTSINIATGSKWYNFWSGFGANFGEFVLVGAVVAWYRRNKCTKCWRFSHHDVAGTHFRTCHIHFTEADHRRLQKVHQTRFPEVHDFMTKLGGR